MSARTLIWIPIVALFMCPLGGVAQEGWPVAGDRVRVRVDDKPYEGEIVRLHDVGLTILLPDQTTFDAAWSEIEYAERVETRRPWWQWALLGSPFGAVVALGANGPEGCTLGAVLLGCESPDPALPEGVALAIGLGAGAAVGALAGNILTSERTTPLVIPPTASSKSAWSLGLRIQW